MPSDVLKICAELEADLAVVRGNLRKYSCGDCGLSGCSTCCALRALSRIETALFAAVREGAKQKAEIPEGTEPYFIEVCDTGCDKCRQGRTWYVIGPDGLAQSTTYGDEEAASDVADLLNEGFGCAKEGATKELERLLNVARGCHDYGGGYKDPATAEVYHHGIQTVINALEAAAKNDPDDGQVNALEMVGRAGRQGKEGAE